MSRLTLEKAKEILKKHTTESFHPCPISQRGNGRHGRLFP